MRNPMQLIDTHCHIDVDDFDVDRSSVITSARSAGVAALVVPGVEAATLPKLVAICHQHEGLAPALGLHPVYCDRHEQAHLTDLERAVAEENPVAIGEVGLDYFVANPNVKMQKALLEAQIRIAASAGLPLLLHIRKAHDDVLALLRRLHFAGGGIAHAFNGSRQQAERFIELGFKLGFGGVATFDRARKIRQLATALPLEALVLETDAPDLPPASHYGQRNSPAYLPEVLATVAELRQEPPALIAATTTANALTVMPRLSQWLSAPH